MPPYAKAPGANPGAAVISLAGEYRERSTGSFDLRTNIGTERLALLRRVEGTAVSAVEKKSDALSQSEDAFDNMDVHLGYRCCGLGDLRTVLATLARDDAAKLGLRTAEVAIGLLRGDLREQAGRFLELQRAA